MLCPEPYLDESFGGYILRLTSLNFYDKPSWIYKLGNESTQRLEFNPYSLDLNKTSLEILSGYLHTNKEKLYAMLLPFKGFSKYSVDLMFKYMTNSRSPYFSSRNRICVECIKEYGFIKKYWDIKFVSVCVEHSCFLMEKCPFCKKYLDYSRKSISICNCGFDLTKYKGKRNISNLDFEITKLIIHSCGFKAYENKGNPLYNTNLDEIVDSLIIVSRIFFTNKFSFSIKTNLTELHELLKDPLHFFQNWPINCNYYFNDKYQNKMSINNKNQRDDVLEDYNYYFKGLNKIRYQHVQILRERYLDYLKCLM
ncbi:hypothetical protein G3A_02805 [Bacillus sp. 17376]|nr:hypothetical protein G3A_02805 [Bacillus sp. 17376]